MSDQSSPVVLVVEDDPDVAESYTLWLAGEYDVRHAADGEAALAALDDTVDVVLLDRMMPGLSGAQVLERIRESTFDPQVAMVTAVSPDFDVVEMGFDDYVTKPPEREELLGTVESLLSRADYADTVQEYHSLISRRAALEAAKSEDELAGSDSYERLQAEIEDIERELDDEETLLDDTAFVGQLRSPEGDQ